MTLTARGGEIGHLYQRSVGQEGGSGAVVDDSRKDGSLLEGGSGGGWKGGEREERRGEREVVDRARTDGLG